MEELVGGKKNGRRGRVSFNGIRGGGGEGDFLNGRSRWGIFKRRKGNGGYS